MKIKNDYFHIKYLVSVDWKYIFLSFQNGMRFTTHSNTNNNLKSNY
jgi:hypothetical protein